MTERVEIRLDGDPVAKGRPRFDRRTGRAYTPEKTARFEDRLAWAAQVAMKGRPLLEGALAIDFRIFLAVPASWSVKKRATALADGIYPISRPDFDNYSKTVDALNRIVWNDDAQVVTAMVRKRYSDRPRVEIFVEPMLPGC
jgi:Holliday junction resolvase RusA-like endonuclease